MDKQKLINLIQEAYYGFHFATSSHGVYGGNIQRIKVMYKGKFLTSFSNTPILPQHDEYAPNGSILQRGWEHILGSIYKAAKSGAIYIPVEGLGKIADVLKTGDFFTDPVDYRNIETEDHREMVRRKEYLKKNYGVNMEEYIK